MINEIEIRHEIQPNEVSRLRARMIMRGFVQKSLPARRDVTYFDTPQQTLHGTGGYARLTRRTNNTGAFTMKLKDTGAGGVKQREEYETQVSNPGDLANMLHLLGLRADGSYIIWREVWERGTAHVTIDETEVGYYAEVEDANERMVKKITAELSISHFRIEPRSYYELLRYTGE